MLHFTPIPATGFRGNNDWGSIEYYDTQETKFSNFDFVEQKFEKKEVVNTVIRILSLARQLGFKCMLEEKLSDNNILKMEEDDWVKKNDNDFEKSDIYRLSFFSCNVGVEPQQNDFLGYAIIKVDFYRGRENGPDVYIITLQHR
jgi:hypothetical protein